MLFVGLPLLLAFGTLLVVKLRAPRKITEVFLWAGEQPEDFRFLAPGEYGIAYVSGTITLTAGKVVATPRTAPMYLPVKGTLHSAVRVNASNATFSAAQRAQAAEEIAKLISPAIVSGVILDFDASPAERAFYRELLEDLRARLPRSKSLSILAPQNWCDDDPWIDGLPIEEAIAQPAGRYRSPLCGESYKLTTGAAQPPGSARRLYYVHDQPWTEQAVTQLR